MNLSTTYWDYYFYFGVMHLFNDAFVYFLGLFSFPFPFLVFLRLCGHFFHFYFEYLICYFIYQMQFFAFPTIGLSPCHPLLLKFNSQKTLQQKLASLGYLTALFYVLLFSFFFIYLLLLFPTFYVGDLICSLISIFPHKPTQPHPSSSSFSTIAKSLSSSTTQIQLPKTFQQKLIWVLI